MDLETTEMLRTSLRHVLTESSNTPLADRLAELGWDDVVAADGPTALRLLFDIKGETLSNADAIGPRLAAALAEATGEASDRDVMIVVPTSAIAGVAPTGELAVCGVVTSAPSTEVQLVVPVRADQGTRLARVPEAAVRSAPTDGIDPDLGLFHVTGTVAGADVTWIADERSQGWGAVVAHGRWLLAAELIGVGRHVVESAVEYTGQRVQYGRRIGTFQALQHRLAGAHVLLAGAARIVEEAAESGRSWDAQVAKCLAGRAAEMACTQAQQCYGAIGFTWEHEFHRYLRRTYLLDQLLGSWRTLEHEIGAELQRTGLVPRIGTL